MYNYFEPNIEPIEAVKWSLSSAVKTLRRNFISLLILGVISAIIYIIIGIIVIGVTAYFNQTDLFGLLLGVLGVLIGGLISCLFFVILFGPELFILGGISVETSVEKTTFPNQGIWKSAKNIFVLSLLGVFFGVAYSISMTWHFLMPVGSEQEPTLSMAELSFWTYMILTMAIPFAFLAGGACIKHFVLRIILYRNRYIPWNYASFLDYASERIFLRKVGGSYIFIHRMLQEHFARMNSV